MNRHHLVAVTVVALFSTGLAHAKVPMLNATCPTGIEVHADEGGPIYINGKEAKLKRINDNFYEARLGGVTLSLSINPDGSPDLSYTNKGKGNGFCTIK